jgi:hypothetical protein
MTDQSKIEPAQTWRLRENYQHGPGWPERVRIVCLYPLGQRDDAPTWVIEHVGPAQRLERMPERTLRFSYQLETEAPST